ncbi:sodium:proton antiporter [Microbacterium sp. NEAU-LLC]|uniref:Sodium:proton antiporter n=1 Tax=Microbacterium helvum TaxID=2773713 RepID=A0ABR8NMZ3_9MICO|nr:sodium:proton antiporter [Microbacterium helvum]MBD3941323.1 sodium:proton antiporter [Microbacterium helvum]
MEALVVVILAVVAIALATAIAPKVRIAGPLILVVVGIVVGLMPFVEVPEIDPEWILVGVLPPLLYSAAVAIPAIEFRRDFGAIAGLSFVLVLISAGALGMLFHWLIPGVDIFLGVALGAILSPTDAVATSIVKRLGLSGRVVTMLEGESLLNDATALVLMRTMVASAAFAVSSGTAGDAGVEATDAAFGFLPAFAWGVFIALVVGGIVGWLNLRLRAMIHNAAANTAIGFVVPFVAYLPTEHLGGSGLVAAVVAGIVTGQGAARRFSPEQRRSDELTWRTVELVLEGAVFLIMGLELKQIVTDNFAKHNGLGTGLGIAALAFVVIMVTRAAYVSLLVWLQSRRATRKQQSKARLESFNDRLDQIADGTVALPRGGPGGGARGGAREGRRGGPGAPMDEERMQRRVSSMRRRVTTALQDIDYYQSEPLGWKHGTVIVWAGMRGVVTLAAAQTLPRDTPSRELLVLIAFAVAAGSLAIQGFTLPWLVKALKFPIAAGDGALQREIGRLDDELRVAAASALHDPELTRRDGRPFSAELMAQRARFAQPPREELSSIDPAELLELRLASITAMRAALEQLTHGGAYSTAALRHALAELDADQLSVELRLRDD